jgi:putative PIN family toxin of toxin-antitoxin system
VTRVVLDANVFASGALGCTREQSTPGAILRSLEMNRFRHIISPHLSAEIERTLASSYFVDRIPADVARAALRMLREYAIEAQSIVDVSGVASHPEDDRILATAVSAAADFLVTGDRQLQQLGSHHGVKIVSPREFLTLLDRLEQDDEIVP